MKVIVGAGNTQQDGWIALQHQHLDIRSLSNWKKNFHPESLDAVLSEHILEHLDIAENEKTAQNVICLFINLRRIMKSRLLIYCQTKILLLLK